jgi:hypothetical protein
MMAWRYKTRAQLKQYQREWHQQTKWRLNPRRHRRTEAYRETLRTLLRRIKATRCCERIVDGVVCGFANPTALQFHHRDHHAKVFNLSDAISYGFSLDRVRREIDKCDVLCANCHAIETAAHWQHYRRQPMARVEAEVTAAEVTADTGQQAFDFGT